MRHWDKPVPLSLDRRSRQVDFVVGPPNLFPLQVQEPLEPVTRAQMRAVNACCLGSLSWASHCRNSRSSGERRKANSKCNGSPGYLGLIRSANDPRTLRAVRVVDQNHIHIGQREELVERSEEPAGRPAPQNQKVQRGFFSVFWMGHPTTR
jgi:hypothetical protein